MIPLRKLFIASVILAISSATFAMPLFEANYGDFEGNTVWFSNVGESSTTDAFALYEAPVAYGDYLAFTPSSFFARSENGEGPDFTNGTLEMTITAKDGWAIDAVSFLESADVTLTGVGTAATNASIGGSSHILVTEINGIPAVALAQTDFVYDPQSSFDLAADGPMVAYGISGLATITMYDIFSDIVPVTSLVLVVDNALSANSELGTIAEMQKKILVNQGLTIETHNIPEPATIALLLVGSGCVGLLKRKDG